MGVVGKFSIQLFAAEEDLKDNITFTYLDYGAIIKSIESGGKAPQAAAPTTPREKEQPMGSTTVTATPAVVPKQDEKQVVALQQQSEGKFSIYCSNLFFFSLYLALVQRENEIVSKAGVLQKKEHELSGKEEDLANRLAELAKREKEFKERESAWEKHKAERKERWKLKKKELESSRQLKKEEIDKEKLEKEKRAKEKKERKEREEKEKAEREKKEQEEKARLEKEKEAKLKEAKALPDKVKCPNCDTSFDPLNPVLENATISLAPLLAPPPPPPVAPAAPPPLQISLVAPAPPPPGVIAHEELKIARGSDGTDFLELLKRGIKLQDAKERKLASTPVKAEGDDWVVPFNVEKIVARRNAMEMSDDEDAEDWDEEWP